MSLPDNTIWHLGHSSHAIKIAGKLLIFDYAKPQGRTDDQLGLENGWIDPKAIQNEDTVVFVSHGHEDHFSLEIFEWRTLVRNLAYVISYDIKNIPDNAERAIPGQFLELSDLQVQVYPSTDEGIAFSIFINQKHIYFSGDNAFWNWDGDLDDDIYIRLALADINTSRPMDIAFQVCDPRLEGMGAGGIYIFARKFRPGLLIPIHSFGDYAFNRRAERRLRENGFSNRFWCIGGIGESYRLNLS